MSLQPPPLPPSLPPRPEAAVGRTEKKSLLWLWIVLGVVGVIGIVSVIVAAAVVYRVAERSESLAASISNEQVAAELGLNEEREGYVHEWLEDVEFEPSGTPDDPDGSEFELIRYPSEVGELAAYLTPDPGDGERRPAVVWAKGGFGGIGSYLWEEADPENDQSVRAFLDEDLVVMCPSWRGENDNPGRFELFFGEVDDLLAAVDFVKSQPHVDPDRVYLAGHSTGGTLVLLAAASGAEVRAAFSFGGAPDMVAVMSDGVGYGNTPYGGDVDRGHELRSAIRYTPYIACPTFYFEGGYSSYQDQAAAMERMAAKHGVGFAAFQLPGDHFDILAPTTELVAKKIKADIGPGCSIEVTLDELNEAWDVVHNKPVDEVLARWMEEGGDLREMLDELGEEVAVDDLGDLAAMVRALKTCAEKDGDEAAEDMATVVSLIEYCYEDDVLMEFEEEAAVIIHKWLRKHAESEASEEQQRAILDVVETLIWNIDGRVSELISNWLEDGFAEGHWRWEGVFDAFDCDDGIFEELLESFEGQPPAGPTGAMLLTRINRMHFDEEWEGDHPYDTPAGAKCLKDWLAPESDDAFAAGFGLAFVNDETREGLVELGLRHPSPSVRMEVAWSDVRTDGDLGLEYLQKACLDVGWSELAVSYLEELELADEVPAAAREPDFVAKADMADWLRHPNELGEVPETLEQIDAQELYWPPSEEKQMMRIFRFTHLPKEGAEPETYYGFVGSTTWSSFEEFDEEPSIETLYAGQCARELNWHREGEGDEVSAEKALELLKKHNPDFGS
ncbi:alpha/beta hydrolase family protein [Haloferula rosea]|uniref:Alpha/beta fold hydrolase n=1 Tax=Haloferula rosea TaxID=490093 RepID=A0A934RF69_9BACT|nr:prolyl oligopeptidase family serine peptidase [Haloferula rosea]MBK1828026.1 alpha/beta fold hydrolase [Haloferula rosea]